MEPLQWSSDEPAQSHPALCDPWPLTAPLLSVRMGERQAGDSDETCSGRRRPSRGESRVCSAPHFWDIAAPLSPGLASLADSGFGAGHSRGQSSPGPGSLLRLCAAPASVIEGTKGN